MEPRIFTPTPHGSPTWRRTYTQCGALERINDGFRFERHNIPGKDKMTARIALAFAVVVTLALGSIRARRMTACAHWCAPPAQAA